MSNLLASLNPRQREAVTCFDAPLLVLAGAGSGKTRVITSKIAYAIDEMGISPFNILAVTFTNKAAKEMSERVRMLCPDRDDIFGCTIKTFHGFGALMLRRFGHLADLSPNFTIYDDSDSYQLLRHALPDLDGDVAKKYAKKISLAKDKGKTAGQYRKFDPDFFKAFEAYQTALRASGNVDFADLISIPTRLLEMDEPRRWAHSKFRMVLVDEYQDTNASQFRFLKRLLSPDCLVTVVGDDDQSIYRFRGAEVENILTFEKSFPGSRVVMLEENYRSTSPILNLANAVIAPNHAGGRQKELFTSVSGGDKPALHLFPSGGNEARYVLRMIREQRAVDNSAILFRTNAQSGLFEKVCMELSIPYRILGSLRFYDREQVKDALALLSLLVNPRDEVAFRRMLNKPARGIGKASLAKIEENFRPGGSCFDAIRETSLGGRAGSGARLFVESFERAEESIKNNDLQAALINLFKDLSVISYYQQLDKKEGRDERESRVDDLGTLVTLVCQYGDDFDALTRFLQEVMLDNSTVDKNRDEERGVVLSTIHNAKGLEWDHVYISGVEEGLIPSSMSVEEGERGIEEERRLFYVAITRAKRSLVMTRCNFRYRWGVADTPIMSRFLHGIDKSLYRFVDHLEKSGFGSSALLHTGFSTPRSRVQVRKPEERVQVKKYKKPAIRHSEGNFKVGDRVNSPSYGSGKVVEVRKGNPEVIKIKFDNGKNATFISKYANISRG